jgi:hypothetical protein
MQDHKRTPVVAIIKLKVYHNILGLLGEDATPTRLSGAGVIDQPGDLADSNGLSLQPS